MTSGVIYNIPAQPITNPPPGPSFNTSTTGLLQPVPAQVSSPQTTRGICSINHQDTGTLRFRTNPNEISWTYYLNTKVENTYGGRVVQILSTKMDDLTVKVDCGLGGWPYLMKVCTYFRDLLVNQRKGEPADFQYTTRGWHMKVFALSIPFQDQVEATVRELSLQFKVQEDVSGVISGQTLSAELKRLQTGIGFQRSPYNTGSGQFSSTGL
jgi:hypothetical protein